MAQIYRTLSLTDGKDVRLCECNYRKGFTHVVIVNGCEVGYTDNIADAYRLYNMMAR